MWRSPLGTTVQIAWTVLLGISMLMPTPARPQTEPHADAARSDSQSHLEAPPPDRTQASSRAGTGELARSRWSAPPLQGTDGQLLPFDDERSLLGFMAGAHIELLGTTSKGINRPRKVRLLAAEHTLDAVFRSVDEIHPRFRTPEGRLLGNLRDSYRYEVAAYRVDRLIRLGRVPPAVLRRVDGRHGSLQLWIHGVTDEQDRRATDHVFKDHLSWVRQVGEHRLFDALIGNVDRNQTNLLIDLENEWLWLIDHTRAFVADDHIVDIERIQNCPRRVYRALQSLPMETLQDELDDILTAGELRALVQRWQRIRGHLAHRVKRYGESGILYGPDD